MKLKSARTVKSLSSVLLDKSIPLSTVEIYWVFSGISTDKWENMTIISNEMLGKEYPKTFGHYHNIHATETTHLVQGEGIYQVQEKFYDSSGKWVKDKVKAVYFVQAMPGDEIVTTPNFAHSLSNLGSTPLLTFDDWREGHTDHDYEIIKKLGGMAYYVCIKKGALDLVPNPNYKELPPPKIISAKNFMEIVKGL